MDVTMTAAELQGPPVGICAKTGGRCDTTKPLVLRYTPPWVFLFIVLLGIGLVFILVALALSTKVRIPLPLSRAAVRDVARRRLVGAGVLVGGILVSFLVAANLNTWIGFAGVLASFLYGLYQLCLPVVSAKMSADGTVLLKGVSPAWVHAMRSRPLYGGYPPMPYNPSGLPVGSMAGYPPYPPVPAFPGYAQATGPIAAGPYEGFQQPGFHVAPPAQPAQPQPPTQNGWTVTPT